jgi:hypothetical protein
MKKMAARVEKSLSQLLSRLQRKREQETASHNPMQLHTLNHEKIGKPILTTIEKKSKH